MERLIIGITAVLFIIIIILIEYLRQRKYLLSVINDILVILPSSPAYFYVGILVNIVFAIPVILFLLDMNQGALVGFAVFYFFELLGVYLCLYGRFGRCIITTDSLILYTPFFPMKKIQVNDISGVKYSTDTTGISDGERRILTLYHNGKKVCSIDDDILGFDLLYHLFEQTGKIEYIPIQENIAVTAKKSDIIWSVVALCLFSIIWLYMIWSGFESFYHLLMIISILFILKEMTKAFLWRVSMDSHTLSVRNSFGVVKTYEISQITKYVEESDRITLYIGEKQIVQIPKKAKNADYLTVRLGSIPHLTYVCDK
ncbi:MAG: hypothetical protein NC231_09165 [Bacillus sp. (in: Bacteria)]|nr:hypothetical protein [Bacillus sp. (in: firmicutes)]MCM1426891.1 hypothetical protein [Eubacterium sp.]